MSKLGMLVALTALLAMGAAAGAQTATAPAIAPAAVTAPLTADQIAAIDEIGRRSVAGKAAPSVVLLVARGTNIIYAKGFGARNVENAVPAQADTRYPIGSNTKQFTAAAILTLQDQGKLNIDDKLSKYLPEIPHANEVTLRQIMTHAGGYAEFTELGNFDELGNRPATLAQVVGTVDARPLAFKPGTQRQYSNTGYMLLTMVIERVSKVSYAQFLQEHFFGPLGMTSTYVRRYDDTFPNVATEYDAFALGPWEHAEHIDYTWFGGAGSIISNAQDLIKWNNALDNGKLLSARSQKEMETPIKLGTSFPGYSFGIMHVKLPTGHRMIAHGGNTTGAATQDARFPDDGDLSIVVLANSGFFSYDQAVSAIYGVLVPAKPSPTPAPNAHPKATPVAKATATPANVVAAEKWLDDAVAGHIDLTKLRADSRAHMSAEHQAALRALAAYGKRTYKLIDIDRRPPSTGYIFLVTTPKKPLLYAIGIEDSGKIGGVDIVELVDYSKLPGTAASPSPSP